MTTTLEAPGIEAVPAPEKKGLTLAELRSRVERDMGDAQVDGFAGNFHKAFLESLGLEDGELNDDSELPDLDVNDRRDIAHRLTRSTGVTISPDSLK